MISNLFGGGIILTLILSFWDKIKSRIWTVAELFICRYQFEDNFGKYGAAYIWGSLKNKKSLSPIYAHKVMGSGKNAKVFIREIGFDNFRVVFFGYVPTLVTINRECETTVYGIKPFINHEKIMLITLKYYDEHYLENDEDGVRSRFGVEYIRGSLNKDSRYADTEAPEKGVAEKKVSGGNIWSFNMTEQLNIGRRVNYTSEEYRQYTTFTKENVSLMTGLYLTPEMIEIKDKLERWFTHKEWFMERSIQWKRGILLYGEPGTGKTSFIAALGEYFKVPIFVFDLATFTNDDMEQKWNRMKSHTPCFIIFEEFDSVFDKRTNVYAQNAVIKKPVSFDCILDIVDGAVKYDGIVLFITTRNVGKIDSALGGSGNTRPGRIDYVCEMKDISIEGKNFIAERVFTGMDNKKELITKVLSEENYKTPAQFKELCINYALEIYNIENK